MEQVDSLTGQITDLWQQATAQGTLLLLPSRLWQLGILVLCIVFAWGLTRWIRPTFHEWIRTLSGRPKWQLRALVVLHRRLGLILFSILIWIAAAIMAEVTPFISRRFLLELVGTITVAILLVGFAVRLVRNNFLRQIVTWFLWIYVTLYYLGINYEISNFLDSLALSFGDMRLSLLTVLQALIAIGVLFTLAWITTSTAAARIHANGEISPSM